MKLGVHGKTLEIDETLVRQDREEIERQLDQYFSGGRKEFSLDIMMPDSFTGTVMEEMEKIPYGETRTYGEIAAEIGTAAVAIGQACGNNPVPVIVPCHRVVASSGTGGYGYGVEIKRKLLALESGSLDLIRYSL